MSKISKIDGLMISSSDILWNAKNNVKMINELKCTNKNVVINNYDSVEEVEEGSCFLKGDALPALWSNIMN